MSACVNESPLVFTASYVIVCLAAAAFGSRLAKKAEKDLRIAKQEAIKIQDFLQRNVDAGKLCACCFSQDVKSVHDGSNHEDG